MRLLRVLLPAVLVLALGAVAWARSAGSGTERYPGPGGARAGLRPTGVGLPEIGFRATTGADALVPAVRRYHDSGAYGRDLRTVGAAARAELARRLAANRRRTVRRCAVRYVAVHHHGLYRRERRCRLVPAPGRFAGRPALVLDIDETSLSNYAGIAASGFAATGTLGPITSGTGTTIAPTLALYRFARAHGVAVFFVTGRPPALRAITSGNLRRAGYRQGWTGLALKPTGRTTVAFKTGTRRAIVRRGYDVAVNLGDQESDLDGGFADRAFRYPNPFYFIP